MGNKAGDAGLAPGHVRPGSPKGESALAPDWEDLDPEYRVPSPFDDEGRDPDYEDEADRRQLLTRLCAVTEHLRPLGDWSEVMIMKVGKTERPKKKLEEKEISWGKIEERHKALYLAAEAKQFASHLQHGAVEVLSVDESKKIEATVDLERILPSKCAYRDKNSGLRLIGSEFQDLEIKAKARLCVGGHLDPDLESGANKRAAR